MVKAKLRAFLERVIRGIFTPPEDPQRSILSRKFTEEMSIYLGENNSVYVSHVTLRGKTDPAIPINMLWQALQLVAMRAGVTLRLPSIAAAPAEMIAPPGVVSTEITPEDGRPLTALSSIGPQNGHH